MISKWARIILFLFNIVFLEPRKVFGTDSHTDIVWSEWKDEDINKVNYALYIFQTLYSQDSYTH